MGIERDAARPDAHAGSAEDRMLASRDRCDAAADHEVAAWERVWARADREALAGQLQLVETDLQTGARTRSAGLADLDRELDRARRTRSPVIVAHVRLTGSAEHVDEAFVGRGARLLREHLRSYDLAIRLGSDRFLFVLSGTTLPDADRRLRTIAATLAAAPDTYAIITRLVRAMPDEQAADLLARVQGAP